MAKPRRAKYITEEQYWNLSYAGRALADYWTDWLPKSCERLQKQGILLTYFQEMGDMLADLQFDLMQNGMSEDGAWEVVKEHIYAFPPER